jgi:hypothetical protein
MDSPIISELITIITNLSSPEQKTIVNLCKLTSALKQMTDEETSSIRTIIDIIVVGKDKPTKSTKSTKSNKPKRALNMFQIYCKAHRNDVVQENPELKFIGIQKILGANWSLLSEEEKQEYKFEQISLLTSV